jgi:hypothetical protein
MTCDEARKTARDAQAGRLAEASALERAAHLETCAACRHEDAAESALTDALAQRLVRRKAPPSLV